MPYTTPSGGMERSRSAGHVPLVESELVQERLRTYRVFAPQAIKEIDPTLLVPADSLGPPGPLVRWAVCLDGSQNEVAVREAYPSTRLGYLQIAGVLIHLEELLGQGRRPLVDPAAVRAATQEALHSLVLPGSNICRADMPTVRDSWRAELFDIFRTYQVEDQPLLDVFRRLVERHGRNRSGGGVVLARCPASEDCDARDIVVPFSGTACSSCRQQLWPTDALRIHEEVSEEHGNSAALGRLSAVLEHLTMVGHLLCLFRDWPDALGQFAFIVDGPLALFGPPGWLHAPILAFIHDIYARLRARGLRPPVIVGIEKTGQFVEHAQAMGGHIPRRTLMMLPDEYIYGHILAFRPASGLHFGRNTYYGRKFFYRTAQDQLLTLTVPRCRQGVPDPHHPAHYPVLSDTLALLDRVGTTLYRDAVIPLALAHAAASIPLGIGSRVLTLLSRETLGASRASCTDQ